MKTQILTFLFTAIFLLTTFTRCTLNDSGDGPESTDNFLVSHEKVKDYLPAFIESILQQVVGDNPEYASLISKVEHGVSVYKIHYNTFFRGQKTVASGLVCVPTSLGTFPVLSYQNGTNTLNSKAPSVDPDFELYVLLEFMASTGFIITIPDYLGFGASSDMFHPYLDKESTVQTVIDMQYATKELVKNYLEVDMSDDLYIAGYSQGGWATMQLQKSIEEEYSDIFDLKASACGAGPYDLNYINDYITGLDQYPMPYFVGYIFNSYYNLGYIATPIEQVFMEPYDSKILTLYDGTMAGEAINNELNTSIPLLFTSNYINNHNTDEIYNTINQSLEANSIGAWKTTTPTMLMHGTEDTFVPPLVTSMIHQNFMLEGVGTDKIILLPLQGETHQSGIIPAGIASMAWFLELKDAEAM